MYLLGVDGIRWTPELPEYPAESGPRHRFRPSTGRPPYGPYDARPTPHALLMPHASRPPRDHLVVPDDGEAVGGRARTGASGPWASLSGSRW